MFNVTSFRSLIAAIVLFATAAQLQAVPSNTYAPYQLVTLTAGTVVNVYLNEAIDAESVSVGNSLDFMVRSNVVVNGKVLIAAGATATGWVKNVKKSGGGKFVELTISVENAMSVDGQMVNLRSIPHIVKAPCGDGSTTANIGTNLSARVLNDIKINA